MYSFSPTHSLIKIYIQFFLHLQRRSHALVCNLTRATPTHLIIFYLSVFRLNAKLFSSYYSDIVWSKMASESKETSSNSRGGGQQHTRSLSGHKIQAELADKEEPTVCPVSHEAPYFDTFIHFILIDFPRGFCTSFSSLPLKNCIKSTINTKYMFVMFPMLIMYWLIHYFMMSRLQHLLVSWCTSTVGRGQLRRYW